MPEDYKSQTGILITDAPSGMKENNISRLRELVSMAQDQGYKSGDSVSYAQLMSESTPSVQVPEGNESKTSSAPTKPMTLEEMSTAQRGATDQQQQTEKTDLAGTLGAIVRGAGPYAAGAAGGAAAGAPFAGVGAVPGALGGMASVALANLVGPLITNTTNQIFGSSLQSPREVWGKFFTNMGVPQPDTAAERVIQEMTDSLGATLAMGGFSPQSGAMPALNIARRAVQDTLANIAPKAPDVAGALVGPVVGAGAEQAVKAAGGGQGLQTAANIAGNLVGDVAATGATGAATDRLANRVPELSSATRQGLDFAESTGRRVMTSDVAPPQTKFQEAVRTISEAIPFGTSRMSAAEQADRVNAVQTMLKSYGVDDFTNAEVSQALTEDIAQNFLRVRSNALQKWTAQKAEIAQSLADSTVDVTKTNDLIQSEMDRLANLGVQDFQPIMNKLGNWLNEIDGKNIDDLETIRRVIGGSYKAEGLAGAQDEAHKVYNKIYLSLRDDIRNSIKENAGNAAYAKWNQANEGLSSLMSDLEDGVISSLLKPAGGGRTAIEVSPERVNRLVFSKDPSDVRAIYNRLDDQGKQLMQQAVLANIANDASTDIGNLSPTRFANLVGKRANELGVVLSEENYKMMKGLKAYLDLTSHAEIVASKSPFQRPLTLVTGAVPGATYTLARAVGTNPLVGLLVGTGAVGAAAGASRIYESPRVRDLLLNLASETNPDKSARYARQLTRILNNAAKQIEENQSFSLNIPQGYERYMNQGGQ